MLEEKEQLEETQREMQDVLHNFKKKNADLQVFYNEAKDKNIELEEEKQQLEKKCTEMQLRNKEIVNKNTHLHGMYHKVQKTNGEMQEEKKKKKKHKKTYLKKCRGDIRN